LTVTNPSRELTAAAGLGTEFTVSLSRLMLNRQPSDVVFEYVCWANPTGSA
jgi:hypothetical protein